MSGTDAPFGRAPAAPIEVVRHERRVDARALDRVLARLDREPGCFHACDVAHEPLFERRAVAFASPPVRIALCDDRVVLEPLDDVGAWLVRQWRDAGDVRGDERGDAFVPMLRRLLARFSLRDPALGVHGAWSFDHWQLDAARAAGAASCTGHAERDARAPRAVLYLATRLVCQDRDGTREIRFEFPQCPADASRPREAGRGDALHGDAVHGDALRGSAVRAGAPSHDDFAPGRYAPVVAEAVARIRRGELLSLTLSQAFRHRWTGDAAATFAELRARLPMPEMFFVNVGRGERLFGASPDLQARIDDGRMVCQPVCGTLPRGADALEDEVRARALMASEKEAAALALCSDAFAQAMHRVCAPGSVRLAARRRIVHFAAVVHGVDRLEGRLREDADAFDALLATAAPPTLAGVPRRDAAAAIATLEASPRGWYGGAVGTVATDGSAWLGTILRAAWLRDTLVEVRTGGSIVAASDPQAEDDETHVKAAALLRVLGVAPGSATGAAPSAAPVADRRAATGPRVLLFAPHDPFADALAALLRACGARLQPTDASRGWRGALAHAAASQAMLVVAGVPGGSRDDAAHVAGRAPGESTAAVPVLLVGEPAVVALRGAAHARHEASATPTIAAAATIATAHAPFEAWEGAQVGVYASVRCPVAMVSPAWVPCALDAHGCVIAARHREAPVIALAFRPESVLSDGREAGARLLALAMQALA